MIFGQIAIDWAHLAILTMAVGILLHELGMLSLGHAGALLTGAYCWAFWARGDFSIIGSLMIGGAVLVIMSLTALRVQDDIFAVVTLALSESVRLFSLGATDLTGGSVGLGPIPRGDWVASMGGSQWLGVGTVLVLGCISVVTLRRWPGVVLGSIRDSERLTQGIGVRTRRVRFTVVALTGAAAALAGALQVAYFGLATPTMGALDISLQAVASAMLAWPLWRQNYPLRSLVGFLLGSAIIVILPPLIRYTIQGGFDVAVVRQALFGALLYVLVHPRSPLSRLLGRS
jgi:branched-chain amino acid transport system permease protein